MSAADKPDAAPVHKAAMDDVVKGRFERKESVFRNWIAPDSPFTADADRYHLFVSLACPWAHRTLITRSLKGLEETLSVTVVHHDMRDGWRFVTEDEEDPPPLCRPEPLYGFTSIRQLYFKASAGYVGRFTVPVLWDKRTETIVSNESSEIIVMLNGEFDAFAKRGEVDLYPAARRAEIDEVAQSFYNSFNNGVSFAHASCLLIRFYSEIDFSLSSQVYRCGFAKTQEAYDEAEVDLTRAMDALEARLSESRYLCGNELTLADVRLFPTLIRFDAVYVQHFKTNRKRVADCPALLGYTRELYQMPRIRATVSIEHIKKHYCRSHPTINPLGIVPAGPDLSYLEEPHGREGM